MPASSCRKSSNGRSLSLVLPRAVPAGNSTSARSRRSSLGGKNVTGRNRTSPSPPAKARSASSNTASLWQTPAQHRGVEPQEQPVRLAAGTPRRKEDDQNEPDDEQRHDRSEEDRSAGADP